MSCPQKALEKYVTPSSYVAKPPRTWFLSERLSVKKEPSEP